MGGAPTKSLTDKEKIVVAASAAITLAGVGYGFILVILIPLLGTFDTDIMEEQYKVFLDSLHCIILLNNSDYIIMTKFINRRNSNH